MLTEPVILGGVSVGMLFITRLFAQGIGLVDHPDHRKRHKGLVPLSGGLALYLMVSLSLLYQPALIRHPLEYFVCITALTLVGAIDDKQDINYKIRILLQVVVTLFVLVYTDLHLYKLGDMFGFGTVLLKDLFSAGLTLLAIMGAITAFNMVDGVDGLLGTLSIVTLGALAYIVTLDGQVMLSSFCVGMIAILVPFTIMNMGGFGKRYKVFMGDSGSMLIGFSVIWILFSASQSSEQPFMRPVTALWIIAIPLMDMAAVMIYRIKQKRSPFTPDREHFHHLCLRIGLTKPQTLLLISALAVLFATVGIIGELMAITEYYMFYLFIGLFVLYLYARTNMHRIRQYIKSTR